jgi:hypothetical protein
MRKSREHEEMLLDVDDCYYQVSTRMASLENPKALSTTTKNLFINNIYMRIIKETP